MAEASTRTVERALALLATICERGSANLADSARDCDLAPSTALRLLRTLESTGFVAKDDLGVYRPGGRMIQLGAAALSSESLTDLAKPMMEKLVAQTGESVTAEEFLVVIGAEAGSVDAGTVGEDDAGLLLARFAEADQFHRITS